jgi:hypothetical protein
MDRRRLAQSIAEAERHIAEGESHIARQLEIIGELERAGHDAQAARDVLAKFREMHAFHIANRDRRKQGD